MDLKNLNKDRKNRKHSIDLSTMVYGKVPPQAKPLEEAVLGALLQIPSALDVVSELLKPETFYVDAHQKIFSAIISLAQKSQPIEILTVAEELRFREELDLVGGPYYLVELTKNVVSAANIETHARIVLQKFIAREIIRHSGELIGAAYEDSTDVFDLLDEAEERILSIGKVNISGEAQHISVIASEAYKQVEEHRHLDTHITGIPAGLASVDRVTRGWQNGDLIFVGARPSVGKTALALKIVKEAALHFLRQKGKLKAVAMNSLEMKAVRLVLRMLSEQSEITLHRLQTGRMDDEQMTSLYQNGLQQLGKLPIYFDDKPGRKLLSFVSWARRMVNKYNVGLIVIDYLQLMSGDGDESNREREVSKISRRLKLLAMELNIPIVALSQLSREIEKRSNKEPQLSDLRESGSIEQDADVVLFLWDPCEENPEGFQGLQRKARVAKQRDGMLLTVDIDFRTEIQQIKELGDDLPTGSWRAINDFTEPGKNGF